MVLSCTSDQKGNRQEQRGRSSDDTERDSTRLNPWESSYFSAYFKGKTSVLAAPNGGLEFGRGLSTEEDPDLWQRDYTGMIETWIELGQPDESAIRKACGRARQVILVTYSGSSADIWWSKNEGNLSRSKNLTVIDLDSDEVDAATRFLQRTMRLQVMIQEGCCQLMCDEETVGVRPRVRMTSNR